MSSAIVCVWMNEWMREWMDVIKYLMNEWTMLFYDVKHMIFSHKFIYFQLHELGMGKWEWCEGGEGPYELPPSRGCPCSIDNIKLFSKLIGAQ